MGDLCRRCKRANVCAAGLCGTCYKYTRTHGRPRPDYLFSDDPMDAHPTEARIARARQKVRDMGLGRR